MKLNFVEMPHEIKKGGDACYFQAVYIVEGHGGLWFYVNLPLDALQLTAVRLACTEPPADRKAPVQYLWNGNREKPTIWNCIFTARANNRKYRVEDGELKLIP